MREKEHKKNRTWRLETENDKQSMPKEPKIVYTDHLRLRLKLRSIPKALPKRIWMESTERYLDRVTGHSVAVLVCQIKERVKEFALSYDEKEGIVQLITVHPIKTLQKLSRIKMGRWQRL